jgi:hypothetical protein
MDRVMSWRMYRQFSVLQTENQNECKLTMSLVKTVQHVRRQAYRTEVRLSRTNRTGHQSPARVYTRGSVDHLRVFCLPRHISTSKNDI